MKLVKFPSLMVFHGGFKRPSETKDMRRHLQAYYLSYKMCFKEIFKVKIDENIEIFYDFLAWIPNRYVKVLFDFLLQNEYISKKSYEIKITQVSASHRSLLANKLFWKKNKWIRLMFKQISQRIDASNEKVDELVNKTLEYSVYWNNLY